jgi:hypothetical protein
MVSFYFFLPYPYLLGKLSLEFVKSEHILK